ncbi:uncharacterized [Tachysurus ichikawai]
MENTGLSSINTLLPPSHTGAGISVEQWQIQRREDRNPVLEEEQREYVSPKRRVPYRGCRVTLSCCAQWLCLQS